MIYFLQTIAWYLKIFLITRKVVAKCSGKKRNLQPHPVGFLLSRDEVHN
jgi:hypothetical protein